MKLGELLDSVGIGVVVFSKLADVNRKTVTRWIAKDIDADDKMIAVINKYKADMTPEQSEAVPVPVSVKSKPVEQIKSEINQGDYDVTKINKVTHRNIALSCQAHGSGGIDKLVIAKSFALSVFKYNQAVQDTITHCNGNGTSFQELRG